MFIDEWCAGDVEGCHERVAERRRDVTVTSFRHSVGCELERALREE